MSRAVPVAHSPLPEPIWRVLLATAASLSIRLVPPASLQRLPRTLSLLRFFAFTPVVHRHRYTSDAASQHPPPLFPFFPFLDTANPASRRPSKPSTHSQHPQHPHRAHQPPATATAHGSRSASPSAAPSHSSRQRKSRACRSRTALAAV